MLTSGLKALIHHYTLPTSTIRNVQRQVRRICMLTSGLKALIHHYTLPTSTIRNVYRPVRRICMLTLDSPNYLPVQIDSTIKKLM